MKRIIMLCFILCMIKVLPIYAQDNDIFTYYYPLKGFELINPYYYNPAFISAEKQIQLDLSGFGFENNQGFKANSIVNLSESLGNLWIGYEREWYSDSKSWRYNLGYARSFRLSKDLDLNAGIAYKRYQIMDSKNDVLGDPYCEIEASNLYLGSSINYKKLAIGLSTILPLKSSYSHRIDNIDHEYADLYEPSQNAVSSTISYQVTVTDLIKFEPILSIDYHYLNRDESKAKYYFGATSQFGKTFGAGFTFGSLNSVNGSINIGGISKLYLLFYSGIPANDFSYYIGYKGWNIVMQVRLNLNYPNRYVKE